jgi:hypothetical protein
MWKLFSTCNADVSGVAMQSGIIMKKNEQKNVLNKIQIFVSFNSNSYGILNIIEISF